MTVIGIENEYGISVAGVSGEDVDPVLLSAAVVTAGTPLAARWDFATESPLRDARGGHLPGPHHDGYRALPDMLTDETRHANRLLLNGARFYVDHAHPEYSGPEVRSARDAVLWDAAGDRIVQHAAESASAHLGVPARVHKNNTDGKGASYGCHENYLVPRAVPFERIATQLSTHLVSRSVIVGAGRVGVGQRSGRPGFQLTQRADFFETRVGLETTVRRPIINTRDEPHADPRRWRRLHVITGDGLLGQVATLVKVGSTALMLQVIAEDRVTLPELVDPVRAFHTVSHDLSLSRPLACTDGVSRTALELQRLCWQAAGEVVGEPWITDASTVLEEWESLLTTAEDDPRALADRVDWAARLRLLEGLRTRRALDWDAPELAALDLRFADLDPAIGLGLRLREAGALRSLVSADEVAAATTQPPGDTRAWLRGQVVRRFGGSLAAVSWEHLSVRDTRGRLHPISMPDPLGHTRAECHDAVERAASVEALADLLDVVARR